MSAAEAEPDLDRDEGRDGTRARSDADRSGREAGPRTLRGDAAWLADRVACSSERSARWVRTCIRAHPRTAVGGALGIGFVLGGGIAPVAAAAPQLARMAVHTAGSWLLNEFLAPLGGDGTGTEGESG